MTERSAFGTGSVAIYGVDFAAGDLEERGTEDESALVRSVLAGTVEDADFSAPRSDAAVVDAGVSRV